MGMRTRIWIIALFIPALDVVAQQRTIPTPPQFQQTSQRFANSQVRPATQPGPILRQIPVNNPGQVRPRFQPQPPPIQRRPVAPPQRAPPIRVQPASIPPPTQPTVRRQPPPTQPALQIRPLTQPTVLRAQPFSRAPQSTRPAPSPTQQFTTGLRTRPISTKPSQPLPPPSTPIHITSTATQKRPIPPSTSSFASTNSIGLSGPPPTNKIPSRSHNPNAHPPGSLPPSNSVVDELNRADDFMAVAIRLKLRRFARHRNRRHADFIVAQQLKNL